MRQSCAVAAAVIKDKIQDPIMAHAITATIQKKLQSHAEKGGDLPKVHLYDKNAPPMEKIPKQALPDKEK